MEELKQMRTHVTEANRRISSLAAMTVVLCIAVPSFAQVQFTGGSTIDFTGFTAAGFTPSPAAGQLDSDDWAVASMSDGSLAFGGSRTSGDYARGPSSGGVNTGGIYAFDVGGGNTAMGVQPTGGDFTPGSFTLRVQNATGGTLSSIGISYVAYYRNDQPRGNSFNFSWSTNDSSYTGVPSLDVTSPNASTGGTWTANPQSTTISGFSVADGGFLYLRWTGDDVGGSSNRDEFALDDIVLGSGGEPMGACYTNGFQDCVVTTAADCTTLGGSYDGDGTVCPAATGACCEGTICTGGISEGDCLAVGGSYRGDDSSCATPGICEPGSGACCVGGACQVASSPNDCCILGGVYLGEGTTCTAGICNQVVDLEGAKAAADGTPITVGDAIIVSTTDLISSANSKSFTIQDMSGAGGADRGITVFGPNADIDAILASAGPGSIVSISGERDEFAGLAELSFITGFQVCGSTSVPAPVAITAADMQTGSATAEALESVLVTLSCVEFDNAGGTFAGVSNYVVTDPMTNQSAIVRVATAALDLVGQPIPAGGVAITGVMGQFNSDYQLQVRSISDIVSCGTAVGACFINGGLDCVVTTQADCTAQSGAYQGDATSCPAPTGACCEQDGTICSDGVSQFDCESFGGSYRGDESLCSTPGICELGSGACCLGDDTCQIAADPADCCTLGGTYLCEGTTCAAGACDVLLTIEAAKAAATGAEITISNVVVTEITDLVNSANSKSITVQDLSGTGGADRGFSLFGPNADIDAILAVASPGSIISITGERAEFSGLAQLSFITDFQVCGSTSIAAPVAITTADMQDGSTTAEELESVRVTLSCVTFDDAGGTFAGGMNYTVTDVISSQTATVRIQTIDLDLVGQTIPAGQVAITGVLSQFDGSAPFDGGYQLMPVSINDINACGDPLGACILPDTSCVITTATDCSGQSGAYQGDGSTCPDPTGACCNGAVCTGGVTQADCENGSGTYQGDGSICDAGTCVVGQGACCLGDDTCQLTADAAACCALGGTFLGEGVTCSAGICDTLLTIAEAKALGDGQQVTLRNVVVTEVTDLASSANSKLITIQDTSGAGNGDRGYSLFGPNADIDAILAVASPGSILSLTATTDSFAGLAELAGPFTNIQVCGSTSIAAPVAISVADLQEGVAAAEELESVRVTLSCVTFDDAGGIFAGGANYTVTDPNTLETTVVRVQTGDLDLVGQTIPTGEVAVTGVLSQFDFDVPADNGYQLLPVSINDIVACTVDTGACCVAASGGSCPTCPGDMNGDNSVDLGDVSDFVNALLGLPLSNPGAASCANTDLDGNGDINGLDTQSFIGLLASGATCGNTCSIETSSDCATLGGTFQGAGTNCDLDPCNP